MGSSCQKIGKTQSHLENDLISPRNHDYLHESALNIQTEKYCLYPKFCDPQTFTYYTKSDLSDFSSEDDCHTSPQQRHLDNVCSIQSELEHYLECGKSSDAPSNPIKYSQCMQFNFTFFKVLSIELNKEDQNFISLHSYSPRLSVEQQRIRNRSMQQEKIQYAN